MFDKNKNKHKRGQGWSIFLKMSIYRFIMSFSGIRTSIVGVQGKHADH